MRSRVHSTSSPWTPHECSLPASSVITEEGFSAGGPSLQLTPLLVSSATPRAVSTHTEQFPFAGDLRNYPLCGLSFAVRGLFHLILGLTFNAFGICISYIKGRVMQFKYGAVV